MCIRDSDETSRPQDQWIRPAGVAPRYGRAGARRLGGVQERTPGAFPPRVEAAEPPEAQAQGSGSPALLHLHVGC
eukprot:14615297-Alexandrium_andersonii.AAC.1